MGIYGVIEQRPLAAEVDAIGLVGKAAVHAEWWVYEARGTVLVDGFEVLHVLVVERDQLAVLVDAGWCHGFGEDGGVAGDWWY